MFIWEFALIVLQLNWVLPLLQAKEGPTSLVAFGNSGFGLHLFFVVFDVMWNVPNAGEGSILGRTLARPPAWLFW